MAMLVLATSHQLTTCCQRDLLREAGGILDTPPPAMLTSSVDGNTWRGTLELADLFCAKVSDSKGLSARFAPSVVVVRRHFDDATARIARLG